MPASVVGTLGSTISNFASLSQTMSDQLSRTPKNIPVASCGTSSTTSYFCQVVVPFIGRLLVHSHPQTGPILCSFRLDEGAEPHPFPLVMICAEVLHQSAEPGTWGVVDLR